MKIIVDNREQRPFSFRGAPYDGVTVEAGTLAVGDYSLAGLTDKVAVERKELADLVTCLGRERDRFERELARGAALDAFAVAVEASWADLASGELSKPYQSARRVPVCAGLCRAVSRALPLCRKPCGGGVHGVGIPPAISGRSAAAVGCHCEGA